MKQHARHIEVSDIECPICGNLLRFEKSQFELTRANLWCNVCNKCDICMYTDSNGRREINVRFSLSKNCSVSLYNISRIKKVHLNAALTFVKTFNRFSK